MKKTKKRVSIEYQDNTYASLWWIVTFFKNRLKDKNIHKTDEYYYCAATIAFTSFSFEAFMNHAGICVLDCWDELERGLSPLAKFKLILETIKDKVKFSKDSISAIKELFKFRNYIAHGKTYFSGMENFDSYDSDKSIKKFLKKNSDKIKWKQFITKDNTEKWHKEVEDIIRKIYDHISENSDKYPNSDLLGMLFSPFEYLGHSKLLDD